MNNPIIILISSAALMFLVIGGLSMLAHFYTLNGIRSKTVGDGQHGVARFLTKKEIKKTYSGSMSILWTKKVERLCCFF